MTVFETFVTQEFNETNIQPKIQMICSKFCKNSIIFFKFDQILLISFILASHMGEPVGHTIDLTSEFLLGTKIAHVWEENESLVISNCRV